MDLPCSSNLNSIIANVRKLQLNPSVYVYNVTPQGTGISAVDVDQHNLHLAYSPGHSKDIYVTLDYDSEVDLTGNLADAWERYKASKDKENSELRMMESSPESSHIHVFRHGAYVSGLYFTPDSNFLLSCGLDGTVKAWSTSGYQLVQIYYGTNRLFSDIHVSSDCKYFAASLRLTDQMQGFTSSAALYSLEREHPISTFTGHTGDTECVRFHPNGLYIATASCDKTVKLWCTRNYKEVRNFQVTDYHEGYPMKLAFSSDGRYLACAYCESIKLWDLASNKMLKSLEIPNSRPNILNLCYNTSGNILAAGGSNKILYLWNMKNDSSESSMGELLNCDNLEKTVYCIKNTSSFFTCVVA